ncbi:MAG: carbohydrate binding family 9 domain-containing protein [Candidatus Aminicenantes bacterium]|nr:carbohydrate binding family 9 domain-containing protein [Candidatus Aminicenantes bacterium]
MTQFKTLPGAFIIILTLVMTLSGFAAPATQATQEKPQKKEIQEGAHYTVSKATSEIKVDGVLDEKTWEDAVVIKLPYEWLPGDNIPAPVDTDCMVTFDTKYLYIGFRCYDPEPAKIRAHLMDRDAIDTFIQDDHVSFMFDTFNAERRGFQFRVNPLGVQADAILAEAEGYEDFSWDLIWKSKGKITDWGYSLEIAIPFNQLRFPKSSEAQTWGFEAERSYPRSVRHRMTSHKRRRDVSCILCQFNKLTGFVGMSTGLNIEIDPTLTASRTDARDPFPAGSLQTGDEEVDPGITVRWGITPNLILNATAYPDFSQVEADVAQLEVNTRFALFYPEKRPFFLEGADFFLTPIQAVFTRTVADPAGGFKFTGKAGRNVFGIFGAYDRINNLTFPSNQGSWQDTEEEKVMSGVFRFRRDVGRGSQLGVLYTGRMTDGYYNHVGGFDGYIRLSRTKDFRFQYLHSETDYADATALANGQRTGDFGGDAIHAEFMHMGRDWLYSAGYRDRNPSFRADYGFVPRVDIRSASGLIGRFIWGKRGSWFTRLLFVVGGDVTYDHDGTLTDQSVQLQAQYQGPLQSTVTFVYEQVKQRYLNVLFDLEQITWVYEVKPAGGMHFSLVTQFGDSVDYANARRADALVLSPFAEIGLGRHINLNLMHSYQRLNLGVDKIFEANLSQVRLIFNFNVRMFVRAIVQYLDVTRDPALYLFPVSEREQSIFSQFLFSYKLNPQTVLFLGYSDNYFGYEGIDITQSDRTFFVKLGYAWTK